MNYIKEKIRITVENLYNQSREIIQIVPTVMQSSDFKTSNIPPADGYKEMEIIASQFEHYWIKGEFDVPEADENTYYILRIVTGIDGWDALNPQGLLYLNGVAEQGLDVHHNEVRLEAGKHYVMHNYFYTAGVGSTFEIKTELCKVYKNVEALYYDISVPYGTLDFLNPNTSEYRVILSCLERTVNLIDNRTVFSKEYFESIDCARNFIKTEFYEKECSTEGKPVVNCIGHTHIDVEWLWDRAVTKEKIQRSFTTAEHLMKFYPEYTFMLSQPELYRYLKEEYPEKYDSLKKLVKENRWEPEGAMYVEADCNLISGESFFRQILHGTEFFRKEFNKECKTLFLPDVFGYSAALPQILKLCNIEYFITSKISWNDTNTMPYDSFMWQGIDGSKIYTSFICGMNAKANCGIQRCTAYVGKITPSYIKGTWDRYQQKEYSKNVLNTFGWGDGGGGPEQADLERYERLKKGLPGMPVAKINSLISYLSQSKKEFLENSEKLGRTPEWIGELYLELHRGTYTSIAKNKRNNRKAEFGMFKAEALSVLDSLFGGTYNSADFDKNWKLILHNQFHDILPGSSVENVYRLTDGDYKEIKDFYNNVTDEKLNKIAENIETNNEYIIYNALGTEISGEVKVLGTTYEISEPIPALGYKAINLKKANCSVSINGLEAESKHYIVRLNKSGQIEYLFDKDNFRELTLNKPINTFVAYEDIPYAHDAWDINETYTSKPYQLNGEAEITPIFDGSRSGFNVKTVYCNSEITQNIWLYSESRRIDFETEVDWHNKHQLLRVHFPVNIHSNKATYEIQFGHVERANNQNTSWDEAKFEVCAHKWADISEYGYGFALMNDCKYGHRAIENDLSLTLIKCATSPNPQADVGMHKFTYSILPHSGDFREAGVIEQAYLLNQPLQAVKVKGKGNLPEQISVASFDKKNVLIESIKKAEKVDGFILRAYECFNSKCNVTLTVDSRFSKVYVCDGLENNLCELPIKNNSVALSFGNFEIKTLLLK